MARKLFRPSRPRGKIIARPCKMGHMARKPFAFKRHEKERTDPVVWADHWEEHDGQLVLVDEVGKEVYSVEASRGVFVELAPPFGNSVRDGG